MKNRVLWLIALTALSASVLPAQDKTDSPPHAVQFVAVEQDVRCPPRDEYLPRKTSLTGEKSS